MSIEPVCSFKTKDVNALRFESKKNGNHMTLNDDEFNEEWLEFIEKHVSEEGRKVIDHVYLKKEFSWKFASEIHSNIQSWGNL